MDGAKNGKPLLLYLSSHNFGAYYAWNDTGYRFDLVRGESPKQKVLAARCRSKKKQKKPANPPTRWKTLNIINRVPSDLSKILAAIY